VSSDLGVFEVHVQCIAQHDGVVSDLLSSQGGVGHGGVPLITL